MKLTVFTPTYNRRELLAKAYESLCMQTDRSFVWLIVDDGSDDDTESLVKEWIREHKIEIRYDYCKNGGKMRAHNRGVALCDTEWFLCLDSDDILVPTAVEQILACESYLKDEKVAGIVAHKGRSETETLYDAAFPASGYSTLYGLYLKGFRGETTLVFKTEILRAYPFPEIAGEKYVPEDYIYDKIDENHVLYILPEILTVCELVSEGYTDRLKQIRDENPRAWFLYYEQRARITPVSFRKWKYLGYYIRYAKRCHEPLMKNGAISPVFVLTAYPAAWFLKWTGRA
ncbi:MAG: glycosyltransferase family 2 protein [Lachnospiraceae bacterium]|nr:glycosyltransferase family 2 protein [Lachnospiraceae bacterium]